jgi:hypothetical protein
VDRLLARIEERHPDIPTCSAAARQKLADAEAAEEARYLKEFTPKVSALLAKLENDRAFLPHGLQYGNFEWHCSCSYCSLVPHVNLH